MPEKAVFATLFETILQRKTAGDPETSYVSRLMHKGTGKINSKITEEAAEVCEAALEDDRDHLVYEICDLLFHTFVLCGHKDISLNEIEKELARRFGSSGIEEKKNRNKQD
ncbi:MAG: phosphoribosyl-ATP diphosphatase [Spirochaetia bacterium]|jgi:phosphoribosyl-ATP pyrophosphohydrolase